jgi:hypothetical protein
LSAIFSHVGQRWPPLHADSPVVGLLTLLPLAHRPRPRIPIISHSDFAHASFISLTSPRSGGGIRPVLPRPSHTHAPSPAILHMLSPTRPIQARRQRINSCPCQISPDPPPPIYDIARHRTPAACSVPPARLTAPPARRPPSPPAQASRRSPRPAAATTSAPRRPPPHAPPTHSTASAVARHLPPVRPPFPP